jgi:hypothetical protein
MHKYVVGMLFGFIAGIIDVIPMVVQKLPWDADLAAFSMWVIVGLFISSSDFKLPSVLKGIAISFLILAPSAIIICRKELTSIIPISTMTLLLGAGLGYIIDRTLKRKSQ